MVQYSIRSALVLLVGMALVLPNAAHAESVIWSKVVRGYFLYKNTWSLNWPSIQVAYHTRVVNTATGAVVRCGSTVPAGTRLSFQFVPHVYTDISWAGTGTINDSPYGDWNANASRGSGSVCVQKNMFRASNSSDPSGRMLSNVLFANFSVDPPNKRITGLPQSQCTTAPSGNVTCTPTAGTTLQAVFTFGRTYGQFWGGAKLSGNVCTTSTSPLTGGRVDIDAQQINCSITVSDTPEGQPPAAPTITANACVAGRAIPYSIVASHPDRAQIRYLIDWNGDMRADQIVPSTGYVASGAPQSVSHTWGSTGPFTVRVAAQDTAGRLSAWTSYQIAQCQIPDCINCVAGTTSETGFMETVTNIVSGVPPVGTVLDATRVGVGGPPGELTLVMNPKITNTTCKATWEGRYVTACGMYRQQVKLNDIAVQGEEDVTPGLYEVRCTQIADGAPISATASCTRNPNPREL